MSFRIPWAACGIQLVLVTSLLAQDDPPDILKQSLPLRTALHHDPTLKSPLDQLLELYRAKNQVDDLVNLYRGHVTQYPQDERGRVVWVRLLAAVNDSGATQAASDAAKAFPKSSFLQFLLYESRRRGHEARAIESLDKAIELEQRPGRRTVWIDLLLKDAVAAGRRDLAVKNLRAMGKTAAAPEQTLEVAQRMIRYEFHDEALLLLAQPTAKPPSPETMVSIQLAAATAEAALDKRVRAGERLDKLLDKLTADYWRRGEIVTRRMALLQTQEERDAMIAKARQRVKDRPRDEAGVLDLAHVLAGLQQRRDALKLLRVAARFLPNSESIERQTLELLDRLHDDREKLAFLTQRLQQQPERRDLVLLRVKTLFQLGRGDEGRKHWDELIADLPAAERAKQLIEMARYLRQAQLLSDAAAAFRQALELQPDRLDVRRELAEVLLASGNRQQMRDTLTASLPENASAENVLDLVQYLISQKLYVDAQRILEARRQGDDENLDVRVLLLDLAQRLGDLDRGREMIDETRELADTSAKYRRWLEAAFSLHDEFETTATFVREEMSRLEGDGARHSEKWLERRLALAEVAGRGDTSQDIIELLKADLESDLPQRMQRQLRRTLIKLVELDPKQAIELQEQLKRLAESDPTATSEVNARLVLLYGKQNRYDLLTPLLSQIDVNQLNDPALLSGLLQLYRTRHNDPVRLREILERLTQVNPTDRASWEQWLTILAVNGMEERLRMSIRRLLAGVDKMELDAAVREQLQRHLVDSFWREISRRIDTQDGESGAGSAGEMLTTLDSLEGAVSSDVEWCWVAWVRAFLLKSASPPKAFDEAVAEFERLVQVMQGNAPSSVDEGELSRIALPDGLSISVAHARRILRSDADSQPLPSPVSRQSPLPPFRVRWALETNSHAPVVAVVPADSRRCVVVDGGGTIYCLDNTTGKTAWQIADGAVTVPSQPARTTYVNGQNVTTRGQPACPAPVVIDQRLAVAGYDSVSCYAMLDGRLLWKTHVGKSTDRPAVTRPTLVSLFSANGKLLTYDPFTATVVRIDPASGKVVWDRQIDLPNQGGTTNAWSSGASLSGNRLLFYGTQAGILDTESGQVLWSFEPWRVSTLPVKLSPTLTTSAGAASGAMSAVRMLGGSMNPYGMNAPRPAQTIYVPYQQPANQAVTVQPQQPIALTTSAVTWAAAGPQGTPRQAELVGRKLLLSGPQGIRVVDTHLPIASRQLSIANTLLGVAGRKACLMAGQSMTIVDILNGHLTEFSLSRLSRPNEPVWFDVALDGPLAFVSGPAGLICVNTMTNEELFNVMQGDESAAGDVPSPAPSSVAPPSVVSFAPNYTYYPALVQPYGGVWNGGSSNQGIQISKVGRVHDGVLFALRSPHELVAYEREQP